MQAYLCGKKISFLNFSLYIPTGVKDFFKVDAGDKFMYYKVDSGLLEIWKRATDKGKMEISKLIQMGTGNYHGYEPKNAVPKDQSQIAKEGLKFYNCQQFKTNV